jgi:nitroreductase
MSIKESNFYKLLRKPLVKWRIYKSFFYEAKRYIKFSNSLQKDKNHNKLVATIIKAYHVVEKGLTMPDMRNGFGQIKIHFLIDKCNNYISLYGLDNFNVQNALSVIFEYYDYHAKINFPLDEKLKVKIENLKEKYHTIHKSEQEEITPTMVANFDKLTFREFAFSRSSVRNYSTENIDVSEMYKAVEIAQNAPSACNRQPSRVHVFTDKAKIESILALQNGNGGFGHLANKLIVLTTDLNGYHTEKERYMNWVDGGIYLMNLVYGLHFYKIGACILNWGADIDRDLKLRTLCGINERESIISLISCGYYVNKTIKVAKSPKRLIEEVITVH